MSEKATKWFPLIMLFLLALLTFWLDWKVGLSALEEDRKKRHEADFVIENLSASALGKDGALIQGLFARKMSHFPDDDSTDLESPQLTVFSSGKADLVASARMGKLSSNGEELYLSQNVNLKRMKLAERDELNIFTEFLHVNPAKHVSDTDRPVLIENSTMEIRAIGMEFNDKSRVLKLLSAVRGIYEKAR